MVGYKLGKKEKQMRKEKILDKIKILILNTDKILWQLSKKLRK
jgi:hypothetical protein